MAKHAQAKQVTLAIEAADRIVCVTIADNGCGFDPALFATPGPRRGLGLFTMTERAEAFGGQCHIESSPGNGTQVIVEVSR